MDYLLDTNHSAALWRGQRALNEKVSSLQDGAIFLCRPCVGDLWYRVFDSARPAENEKSLREFLARYPILDFDAAAAVRFGQIKTTFRKINRPISDVDSQVAAIALVRDLAVVTADQHFSVIAGLKVENWLASTL